MPEPSRGSSPGRAATLTMRPPLAPPGPSSPRLRIARIAAAEHRKDDSACIWNWSAKSTGEVEAGRDMDARIVAVRIFFEFGGDHVRHMAHRAGGAQRADDGGPQRAGPAGDHDIGVVISDHGSISRSARRRSRAGRCRLYHA